MLTFLLVAVAVSAIAAIVDYRTGQIPNWLTLGGIVAGVVGHLVHGWVTRDLRTGLIEAAFAVAGLLFCSIAPAILYVKGGMGGGDLKLYAAIGALCQPMLGIEAQMYSMKWGEGGGGGACLGRQAVPRLGPPPPPLLNPPRPAAKALFAFFFCSFNVACVRREGRRR